MDTIRNGTSGGKIRRMRAPRALWLYTLIVVLALLLAACDSQSSGTSAPPSNAAPTSTSALAGGPGPTAAASPSAQATTTGATGQVGFNSVCSQPAGVTAQLPASIPAYPGARLQISQAQGGNALYGLCSSDGRAAIAAFYAAQLPAKGWGQLQASAIDSTQILTAAQGNAHVVVTIQPDPLVAGKTQIVIQATGV